VIRRDNRGTRDILRNEGTAVVSRSQRLSQSNEESWPTIRFYCVCGKWLYTLGTNIQALWHDFDCPRCGQKYTSRNSIIAVAVHEKFDDDPPIRKGAVDSGKTVVQNPSRRVSTKSHKQRE